MTKPIRLVGRHEVIPDLRRTFWLGAVALAIVVLTLAGVYWIDRQNARKVSDTETAFRIAREARSLAIGRENAIRGYLLSGNEEFRSPQAAASKSLDVMLDSLVLITIRDPERQERARSVRTAARRWDRVRAATALAIVDGGARADRVRNDLVDREMFDSLRSSFETFLVGEQRAFASRVGMQSFAQRLALIVIAVEVLSLIAILGLLGRRVVKQAEALLAQRDQLEDQAAQMEEQTGALEEQSDEAARVSDALQVTNADLEATVKRLEATQTIAETAMSRHREAESLLDFVLNSSPVGFCLHDRKLRLVRINEAGAAMSALPPASHIGKMLEETMPADYADAVEPVMQQVLKSGEPVLNYPIVSAHPADPTQDRQYIGNFFPVRLERGRPGVGSVILETTQYRHLEEQLLQAQKMEAVGRLAGGVAHDFNNMLTAIKSYSELLLADVDSGSSQASDLNEINKAADRASALTRQLLAFSRQQVLQPRAVNLNHIVADVQKHLGRLTSDKVEITARLEPGLWTVTADPIEIERVITNLVLNARDAMPDGGRLLLETSNMEVAEEYASTQAGMKPGSYVMLTVTDTGSGMSREIRERVFEPFFTTKEKGKGTGLGLSSVYGIVRQSGGFVVVSSELGSGTTFKVYLPRALEAAPVMRRFTPRQTPRVDSETILIVEDDDEVRNVATRILRRNGYRVLEAANGAEALRVCESEPTPVDLIVTDIVMPEMGGSELAGRIRESQPDARILFTSGYTEDAVVRQSFLGAGEAFIEKPFSPSSLARKAREMLDAGNEEEGES